MMLNWLATIFALSLITTLVPSVGYAQQTYPNRPIRFIIPFPAGGATDAVVRAYAQHVSEIVGQPIVADYRPGAGSNIGAAAAVRSDADGYTLYATNFASHAVNRWLYKELPYDPVKDFTPVAMLSRSTLFLCSKPGSSITSVTQLIEEAKKNPGKLNYGSPGLGTPNHIAGELLKQMAHISVQHVPYRGGGALATALLAGEIDFAFDGALITYHRDGRLKCFAGTADFRWPTDPNVPTVAETVPGYNVTAFFGVAGPAKMPQAIVEKLNNAFRTAAQRPDLAKTLELVAAALPFPATLGETKQFLSDQNTKWEAVVKASGAEVR